MAETGAFGQRLRWVRKKHALTLEQFAERCGCDKSYVSRLERDVASNPSIEFIERVCQAFEISRGWLELGEGLPSTEQAMNLHKHRYDFPALVGLSDEELSNTVEHFTSEAMRQTGHLKRVYDEMSRIVVKEVLRRWREPKEPQQ